MWSKLIQSGEHGKGVEDATLSIINLVDMHLEKEKAHAIIVCCWFFISVQDSPTPLVIETVPIWNPSLAMWILDFTWETSESVCEWLSDSVCISTGQPQGYVLSPLLFILYTYNCKITDHENRFLIKFPDDIAVVSLLFGDLNGHAIWTCCMSFCKLVWCVLSLSECVKNKRFFHRFQEKKHSARPHCYSQRNCWSCWSL